MNIFILRIKNFFQPQTFQVFLLIHKEKNSSQLFFNKSLESFL